MLYPVYASNEMFINPAINLMAHFGALNARAMHWREGEAICTMFERATRRYNKPAFGLTHTLIDGRKADVREEVALARHFGNLLHFRRDTDRHDPKLLIVAPMSGHHATLLRGTVEALLPAHDVYITDWKNARDIPASLGTFGFDDYVAYVRDFIRYLGPDTHVMAVCQPAVPALAAVALMAQDADPCQPLSMTLMGGPIDPDAAPTEVNRFAARHSLDWFKDNVIHAVPFGYEGFTRNVYPGFLQLSGFMSMNIDRHVTAHHDLFEHLCRGDGLSAARKADFYDEYLAVMDLPADFYLDTIERVFKRQLLARGELEVAGRRIDPGAIARTGLLTVEGARDDICAPGQTIAAHNLCTGLPPDFLYNHLEPEVGHYGTFEGSKYRAHIAPRIAWFIRHMGRLHGHEYSAAATLEKMHPFEKPQNSAPHKHFPYKTSVFQAA